GTSTGDRFSPAVAASKVDYLVVWQDTRDLEKLGTDIYGARVTTAGAVSDPTGIAISTAANNQSSPALAFNGTDYVVVWADERNLDASGLDIYGTRVSSAGIVANRNGVLITIGAGDEVSPA